MADMDSNAPPWTWRKWIEAKAEMEERCKWQVREAERRALDAEDRERRASADLERLGWYDQHREMVERVAEDAAREAAREMASRIGDIAIDVLEAIRERLSSDRD